MFIVDLLIEGYVLGLVGCGVISMFVCVLLDEVLELVIVFVVVVGVMVWVLFKFIDYFLV